jgi:transposase
LEDLKRRTAKGEEVFAQGYECVREQSDTVAGKEITWAERVQVIRSLELAKRQAHQLEERLQEASRLVRALTPPVGRGHHQYREEEALRAAVTKILEEKDVVGLLQVSWQREEQKEERYCFRFARVGGGSQEWRIWIS